MPIPANVRHKLTHERAVDAGMTVDGKNERYHFQSPLPLARQGTKRRAEGIKPRVMEGGALGEAQKEKPTLQT